MSRCEPSISIAISLNEGRKWTNEIRRFSFKIFANFNAFSNLSISHQEDCILAKKNKILKERSKISRKRLNENLENLFQNCPNLPISIPTNVTLSVLQNSDNYPDGIMRIIHQVPGCDIFLFLTKELSFQHKPWFSIPYIFVTQFVDLRYFKLRIINNQISKVYTIRINRWKDEKF